MYLSKLVLQTKSQQVRHDISNPYNLHRTIMRAFPSPFPKNERVLFRIENSEREELPVILVQSLTLPEWSKVEAKYHGYFGQDPETKSIERLFTEPGQVLRFRLRANPTKRVIYKNTGNSQRISLFKEQDRCKWLSRKAMAGGFSVMEERLLVRSAPYRTIFITQEDKTHKATINMVDFDGLLTVFEPEKFLECVHKGIGPAKGLGCGLLSLAIK